ncbi:prenyltransferase [Cryobacterium psychrophilum]|uniref:Prenyltransferase n=1 Tax=Cryobacterium psychrophilum TaxID=41988 RepID=A0A4Y8KR69_9MICO|nr:prenyltransferase [Cryobacterium psychrophilum]TDW29661.1 4-hydroxybenzoate polyprenyltransferase [Cryobacterium psychrophilum]TFD81775.1 prenyltransferase [Cryobacterium psychrophilum]
MSANRTRRIMGALFLASRPVSWINTAFPFAAVYYLTVGEIDAALLVGTIFFLVPYNLAMYGINDVFDYESDLANPRKGGLEGAVLQRADHRLVLQVAVLTAVPFIIVLVLLGNPLSWLVLAVSLFAVAAYSVPGLRFKEKPFLDSITSSTHFVSPALYGLVLAGATLTFELLLLLIAVFLWGIASHAFGAVQDVVPDRAGGIRSVATVMGARWTVRFAMAAWAVAGLLMLPTTWPGPLAALLVLPYIATAMPFRSVSDEESEAANRGWKRFLWINYSVGFLITLLLIIYVRERP